MRSSQEDTGSVRSDEPLWGRFYDSDPFEGFPLNEHPPDTQGWGSYHPVFEHAIAAVRPTLIAELGTWKGASALHMASVAHRLRLRPQIVCVDTWLGAPEHILRKDYYGSLRMKHGYPQLFHTFMSNVIRADLQEVITPLPQTSENAAIILGKLGMKPDLIYVDAAHEYEPVRRDLRAYWPLLANGGLMFGDDYPNAGGVVSAVHEFAAENDLQVVVGAGKWILLTEDDPSFGDIGMRVTESPTA